MANTSLLTAKVQLGFGSAFLILLLAAGFSYRGLVVSNESDRWVSHTNEVMADLQELRAAVDLATLWAHEERIKSARALLQPVFDRFEEGSNTADLRAAERLLATLD